MDEYYWYYYRSNSEDKIHMYPCKTEQEAEELNEVASSDTGGKASGMFGYFFEKCTEKEAKKDLKGDYNNCPIVVVNKKPTRISK